MEESEGGMKYAVLCMWWQVEAEVAGRMQALQRKLLARVEELEVREWAMTAYFSSSLVI